MSSSTKKERDLGPVEPLVWEIFIAPSIGGNGNGIINDCKTSPQETINPPCICLPKIMMTIFWRNYQGKDVELMFTITTGLDC